MENESLRDQLQEVQSSFTRNDHEYLELAQKKYYAETEYDNYRSSAQNEIRMLAEDIKDKEMELVKIKDQMERAKNGKAGFSHASGFSIDNDADKIK